MKQTVTIAIDVIHDFFEFLDNARTLCIFKIQIKLTYKAHNLYCARATARAMQYDSIVPLIEVEFTWAPSPWASRPAAHIDPVEY